MKKTAAVLLGLMAAASTASAQEMIAVIDSTADRVMLFSPVDGSLVNANWIALPNNPGTPKGIARVNDEIWVTDQIRDKIWRFTRDMEFPSLLGEITGAMDNIRGLAQVGDKVWVANAGTNNGAPGDAIVVIDAATATLETSFAVADPFDVLVMTSGNVLVNDIDNDAVHEYTPAGVLVGTVIDSDGVSSFDFPQQMAFRANGNLLVSGFTSPSGIFEFDEGLQLNYWDVNGGRGIAELDNGNILFTSGAAPGVFVLDPTTLVVTPVGPTDATSVSGQYAMRIDFGTGGGCAPCAADYDQSGGVDGDDIGAFFNDWTAGTTCADVDESGGVDGDDIGFFFTRWTAGGCD